MRQSNPPDQNKASKKQAAPRAPPSPAASARVAAADPAKSPPPAADPNCETDEKYTQRVSGRMMCSSKAPHTRTVILSEAQRSEESLGVNVQRLRNNSHTETGR